MKIRRKLGVLDRRRTLAERIFFIMWFLILALWSAILIFMFIWAFVSSLKTNLEFVNEPLGLPAKMHWENYMLAMKELELNGVDFVGLVWNSLWQTFIPAVTGTVMHMITGYIFAQYDFKGKSFLFGLVVFIMIIPLYGNMSAEYKLNYDLGLVDSYWYLIRYFGGLGSQMLFTYGYYRGLPRTLREAVYIDGGSEDAAFWHVYFPMGRNIFTALFLIEVLGKWNDYNTPLLYLNKMPNLALGLYDFQQEIVYVANNPAYFAGAFIVMAPMVVIFILFSDKMMGQLNTGGIKG